MKIEKREIKSRRKTTNIHGLTYYTCVYIVADLEILSSEGGRELYHENISKDNPTGILVINNEQERIT